MKNFAFIFIFSLFLICPLRSAAEYVPSQENLESRKQFADDRFGIFIHWGIYSMFGQGEWFHNNADVPAYEYAKAASGFYPSKFDAREWIDAIKGAGAKYICFTSRHHDGFSMFKTEASDYNIVDATPFGRDVLKELSEACYEKGINLHLYYSHLDWTRDDYPKGRTGPTKGRNPNNVDWQKYYAFMNSQLRELLTNYGPVRAIWFDGWWDHDVDSVPFNWELDRQYELIHSLRPACLIGNNHHQNIFPGEDIQIFERDVPGENTAGYSEQDISVLPLETCQTMNGMWGYKITDLNYKDTRDLIQLLVRTAGKNANLLLNVGPQPNGEIPAEALLRLKEMGDWMKVYGETIYATTGSPFPEQDWGTATVKDNRIFLHILKASEKDIKVPLKTPVNKAVFFSNGEEIKVSHSDEGIILHLKEIPTDIDCVIEVS